MGAVAIPVAVAGLALQGFGAYESYKAAQQSAAAHKASATFDAAQLEQGAGQAEASGQREAIIEDRQAKLVTSRALALAAASGASATDPTVMNILGQIGGEGAYRKSLSLYGGEEKARQMRLQAASERATGEIAARTAEAQGTGALYGGVGSVLTGASSLYSKYGYGAPRTERNYG